MKKILSLTLVIISLTNGAPLFAQEFESDARTVTILAVNDMHAALDMFPRFAGVVDSVRAERPELLLLSAGDIRSGNPVNDRHDEPGLPMITLMNIVGFDASAVGNHEFDSGPAAFSNLIGKSNFRFLCANMDAPDSLRLHTVPYRFFEREGVRIGVLGLIHTGHNGLPDTHPNNLTGIRFQPPVEAVTNFRWMREQCDVLILLNHCNYPDDLELADAFPEADVIIGGHEHAVLANRILRNGVIITQTGRELRNVTELTIEVSGKKITNISHKLINVRATTRHNPAIQTLVDEYNSSPIMRAVLAVATPFANEDETGALMADAQRDAAGTDIALQNYGGVRFGARPAGDFTMQAALSLDPFGNELFSFNFTGEQIVQLIVSICEIGEYPYPSGGV